MAFISAEFIVFCCVGLPLFFFAPGRFRLPLLLLLNLVFYSTSSLTDALLLVTVTLIDYAIALRIGRSESPAERGWLLVLSLALNIGLLLTKFVPGAAAPLGVSFFTFAKIAYVVDVYRRKIEPERSPVAFAVFVSFFPNLISGPIERAGHLIPQLKAAGRFDDARAVEGLRLILWGVFKKVVIADRLALYVNPIYDQPQAYQGAALLMATFLLAFQIYADFSGYTDIARGVARILGVDLFENFRQPYLATSVLDFWRRWHISLTTWIREYLFFPLSRYLLKRTGRRFPRAVEVSVYLIVMGVVGLWHGANWTFLVWGLLHGLYMGVESLLNARRIQLLPGWAAPLKTVTMFVMVSAAWVFFRARSLEDAGYIFANLFNFGGDFLASFSVYTPNPDQYPLYALIALALAALLFVADWIDARWGLFRLVYGRPAPVRWAVYYSATALILLALLSANAVQTFVYFQF